MCVDLKALVLLHYTYKHTHTQINYIKRVFKNKYCVIGIYNIINMGVRFLSVCLCVNLVTLANTGFEGYTVIFFTV